MITEGPWKMMKYKDIWKLNKAEGGGDKFNIF